MKPTLKTVLGIVLTLALLPTHSHAQGSLTPPGPPAPTMKSLSDVEPRIPISSLPVTIGTNGSYYITTNLVGPASPANGITIQADNVTIDLRGYSLSGAPGGTGAGINFANTHTNLVVRNGTICNWGGDGIFGGISTQIEDVMVFGCKLVGIDLSQSHSCRIHGCRFKENGTGALNVGINSEVTDCASYHDGSGTAAIVIGAYSTVANCTASSFDGIGISAGTACTVTHCSVAGNSHDGIDTSTACTVSGCTAVGNQKHGFSVFAGSVVTGCSANQNGLDGFQIFPESTVKDCSSSQNSAVGMAVGDHCNVTGCTVAYSGANGIQGGSVMRVTDCIAVSNTGQGVTVADNCFVSGCLVNNDSAGGIQVGSLSIVRNNSIDYNQSSNTTAGLLINGSQNRVEGNNITRNGRGIKALAGGNFITGNTVKASSSAINFDLASGNIIGPIVAPPTTGVILGNTGGAGVGSTDPSANFSY